MILIPEEVQQWLRNVFQGCNHQATAKLDNNPFVYEEHLDISVVEILQQHSSPVAFNSGWTVQIQTHFLGKYRMYRNFEVADIGLLLIFSSGGRFVRSKVGLLQSKRLYPHSVEPESEQDSELRYRRGFSELFATDTDLQQLALGQTITFDSGSRYKAIKHDSEQLAIIDDYERNSQIPVYYLLYNPSVIPLTVTVPGSVQRSIRECKVGARVVTSRQMHSLVNALGSTPRFIDLEQLSPPFQDQFQIGWPLEYFVVDLLLQCKTGRITDVRSDQGLYDVFYRRSGPIASALSITIDAPADFEWSVIPDAT